jgi:hypothetical protein
LLLSYARDVKAAFSSQIFLHFQFTGLIQTLPEKISTIYSIAYEKWRGYCSVYLQSCTVVKQVVTMITKIFRYFFLCVVFVSGALIGGIYAPHISIFTEAENHQNTEKSHGIKPTKRKPAKKQRLVVHRSGFTHA